MADLDPPLTLTEAERRSMTDHMAYGYLPSVVIATVERIVAARIADARADERERIYRAMASMPPEARRVEVETLLARALAQPADTDEVS